MLTSSLTTVPNDNQQNCVLEHNTSSIAQNEHKVSTKLYLPSNSTQ